MMNPLVSVVLIFLDAQRYLKEAIESVFTQTYQNWELLLIDDGSSDSSTRIALDCAAGNPEKVYYYEHPAHQNRGMSATRNLGIFHSKGKYVALIDSDDVWLPNKLEQQVAILNAHPDVGLVYGLSQYWKSWTGNPEDRDTISKVNVPPNTSYDPPLLLRLYCNDQLTSPSFSNILFQKDVYDRTSGFEEQFRGMFEDQVFLVKVLLKEKVFISNEIWDKYRDHENSCVSIWTRSSKRDEARLEFLQWFEQYLEKKGLKHSEFWHSVEKKLWPYRHPHISRLNRSLRPVARKVLSAGTRSRLKSWLRRDTQHRAVRRFRFGDFNRIVPINRTWGLDRGLPIDRYYIEKFLSEHCREIKGRVLEIQNDTYTRKFGEDRVTNSDVIDLNERNPKATIVADLTHAEEIPSDLFDCIIFTQTLQLIEHPQAALATLYRILKPGGTLLATFPGISSTSGCDRFYWLFTRSSASMLFRSVFPHESVHLTTFGNVLAAISFLEGLAVQDLAVGDLDFDDPDYAIVICVRAAKPLS